MTQIESELKKIDRRKDYIQPVFIDNFCNCRSALAKELMAEAAVELKRLDWQNEFVIYYYGDKQYVRLYLRMAYVAAFHIDGKWDEIKARLPKIIPLLLATVELRKEKNIGLFWIEKDLKDLQWAPLDAPCIFCETYRTDKNLQ